MITMFKLNLTFLTSYLFWRIYLSNDLFFSYFWCSALYSYMLISPIRRACCWRFGNFQQSSAVVFVSLTRRLFLIPDLVNVLLTKSQTARNIVGKCNFRLLSSQVGLLIKCHVVWNCVQLHYSFNCSQEVFDKVMKFHNFSSGWEF
jgi:hypothetical protein